MRTTLAVLAALALSAPLGAATTSEPGLAITRAAGAIEVDGRLDEPAWQQALRVETWYETNPGDNTPPPVRNVGWLTYDDQAFYAALELEDPQPGSIRAPYLDRDQLQGDTDYAGLVLDPRNDGRTGLMLFVNPRGSQYDAVSDDATGSEDNAPDFFWTSAARVGEHGWTLELRIPFASLRYPPADPATWRVIFYRNYPRAYRYQFFSARIPRGSNCLVCRTEPVAGLTGLPHGGSYVAAPYVTGRREQRPVDGAGSPLDDRSSEADLGGDFKWTPNAQTTLDGTLNPDFSQIESDVAQIGVNERFALLYPEKRPFFLEGVELLSTPVQAVYTRSITQPRWGARGTSKDQGLAWTGLVAQDEGGGSVILPGPDGSDFAAQDFRSWAAVGRVRRNLGVSSFVSLLGTGRVIEGGGGNLVLGPDFQYRTERDQVTGQLLYSRSDTPVRPDLAEEWDGRQLKGHAGSLSWFHSTARVDWYGQYQDFGDGFRADDGFVPQVGFRELYGESGYTFRPQGFVRRLRTFAIADRTQDRDGRLVNQLFSIGTGLDARFNSFARIRFAWDRVRAGDGDLPRRQLHFELRSNPSRRVSQLVLRGWLGDQVDFAQARLGRGGSVVAGATLRPTDHLELAWQSERRWLDVPVAGLSESQRLFTAEVDRLKATYTFTSRLFLRAVLQHVGTRRDPDLYAAPPPPAQDGALQASLLFAYKLNWQTVVFLGYGDDRALDEREEWRLAARQLFLKLSYAFQG